MSGRAQVLEYGTFPNPPSPLFRDYLAGAPGVRPFYEADARWDQEALLGSLGRVVDAAIAAGATFVSFSAERVNA